MSHIWCKLYYLAPISFGILAYFNVDLHFLLKLTALGGIVLRNKTAVWAGMLAMTLGAIGIEAADQDD